VAWRVAGTATRGRDAVDFLAHPLVSYASLADDGRRTVAIAWYPPSTCITSPVIARAIGDNKKQTASATGEASFGSHASGEVVSHAEVSRSKSGIASAARVAKGPAATRLLRIPRAPRSRAM